MPQTCKELSRMLANDAERVARYLLPNGKKSGHEFKVGNAQGESGESLSICLSGDKAGVWADFATGEGGDLIDLWQQTHCLSLKEALAEIKSWLGVQDYTLKASSAKTHFKRPANLRNLNPKKKALDYLCTVRKLDKAILETFKVTSNESEIIFPYWRDDELLQIKYLCIDRPDGKKQIRTEKDCEPCLFGWQALPKDARSITLTEGEIDAMTLYQYGIPALSLPFGGGIGQKQAWLEYEFDRLAYFDEIYLCLDQDEVGQQTVEHLAKRLGYHRCKVVKLPYKDANECLQQGITADEIKHLFAKATTYDPQELKPASAFLDRVLKQFSGELESLGVSCPWPKAKGIRFREGELSIWTGINGHGKSQFLGHLALHFMKEGKRLCIASLEMRPERLLYRLIRQGLAEASPSPEKIKAAHLYFDDKLWLFDVTGSAKTERILDVFAYAKKRYEVDIFIIDSLMKCGLSEDDYNSQKLFVEALCDFKNEYNCHVHLIAHPRKDQNENTPPGKMDVKGSGAITDLADNCFSIWRNKGNKAGIHDCLWQCDKQRNGDFEGKIGLYFHQDSYQFVEEPKKPVVYINLS